MFAALCGFIVPVGFAQAVGCEQDDLRKITSQSQWRGVTRQISSKEPRSAEGSLWEVGRSNQVVRFLARTDFGESGQLRTEYQFLDRARFLLVLRQIVYTAPISPGRLSKAASETKIFAIVCRGDVWIPRPFQTAVTPTQNHETAIADAIAALNSPELRGLIFTVP